MVAGLTVAAWSAAWSLAAATVRIRTELDRVDVSATMGGRPQATLVLDRHGRPAFSYYVEQRTDVPLASMSPRLVAAVLAVEDQRFPTHSGVDPIRMAAAAWRNWQAGRIVQGASTITQQLARVTQLSPERTYTRKLREILVAVRLEERYSKDRILEEYLNTVYLGEGYYGVEAASRGYFGKPAAELDAAEGALLAALVRSPSHDAPRVSATRARSRRNLVLGLMHGQGRITAAELRAALEAPLPDRPRDGAAGPVHAGLRGQYFQEEIRRQLVQLFGSDRVLRGGLRVHSTYDPALQRHAEEAIAARLAQIAKRRRGAEHLQAALVAIDPRTGDVHALVGGRSFAASRFNRATQARRQAGSAFKPIVYAAALERGYAPGTLLRGLDAPIEGPREVWLPGGEHEADEYTLRAAMKVSSNRAAAQLLQQVGISTAIYYARRLGISSPLPVVPSLALGTGEVTLLELTAAYSAFANDGLAAAPRLILRVEDAAGRVLWSALPRHTQAVSQTTAFLMSSMLADVVSGGTAAGARTAGFRLPAAGKTGTTDDYADAWFVGYTPRLLAGVWFGLDQPAPIMRNGFGGVVAVPAWAAFMRDATQGAAPEWYRAPSGLETVSICRLTGLRASARCAQPPEAPSWPTPAATALALDPTGPSPALEPATYEDLFPAADIPAACDLHPGEAEAPPRPTIEAMMRTPLVTGAQASPHPRRGSDLVVERSRRPDGSQAFAIRVRH